MDSSPPRSPSRSTSSPPPPPLSPSTRTPPTPTNTLALLLPHPFLFDPSILALLRDHFASFGDLHTFAPIRAFGRAILVYWKEEDAMRAKREGDRLQIGGERDPAGEGQSQGGQGFFGARIEDGGQAPARSTTGPRFVGPSALPRCASSLFQTSKKEESLA